MLDEDNMTLFKELWAFFRSHRTWWLVPTIVLLLVLVLLLWLANGPALSPFLYGH
jgi:hypothetical protein